MTQAQPGDLLLYRHDASLVTRAIAFFTNGPYSHCGVMVDQTHSIEARSEDGVQVRTPFLLDRNIDVVPVRAYGAEEDDITAGIKFLRSTVGTGYSYFDVFDNLPFVRRVGVFLTVRNRFDCSHLVADYLEHLNCRITTALRSLEATQNIVSPNDIGRAVRAAQQEH